MALENRPLHDGRTGLGPGVNQREHFTFFKNFQGQSVKETLRSGESSPQLQLVNDAVHPWVRRGGLPGRRSHTSKTKWALGFISTVRIGAGAGRTPVTQESGDTDQQTSRELTLEKPGKEKAFETEDVNNQ